MRKHQPACSLPPFVYDLRQGHLPGGMLLPAVAISQWFNYLTVHFFGSSLSTRARLTREARPIGIRGKAPGGVRARC